MANELVVPCWTRGRMWPTLVYFIGVSASSLRLYKGSHAAGPWIVALYSILIAVPVCRVLFKKRFVFTGQPKSIQCESRFAEILVNTLRGNAEASHHALLSLRKWTILGTVLWALVDLPLDLITATTMTERVADEIACAFYLTLAVGALLRVMLLSLFLPRDTFDGLINHLNCRLRQCGQYSCVDST